MPFSVLLYSQRFKILTCFPNGLSKNPSLFMSFLIVLVLPCNNTKELNLSEYLLAKCVFNSYLPSFDA